LVKQLDVTIPFKNAICMMSEYSKLLKDLITKKKILKDYGVVTLEEDCNAILENPKKLGDPSSFTIPIPIGNLSIGRTFLDLGSSINLMTLSLLKNWKSSDETNTHDDTTSGLFH